MRNAFALLSFLVSSALASGPPPGTWYRVPPDHNPPARSEQAPGASANTLFPVPEGVQVEPELDMKKPPTTPGAKFVKIRQGPFEIAASTTFPGQFVIELEKPCQDCFITAIQGGLEFENGTPAHVDHGAVLHHLTIYNGNVRDMVCAFWNIPLPNRIYSTGNEREVARINPGGAKYGLNMTPDEWYSARFDIMNSSKKKIRVFVTQTYEIVEKSAPESKGYKNATTAWIDVSGCAGSLGLFSPAEGRWEIKSYVWESTISGTMLFSTGHAHDGAVDTTLFLNFQPVCVSTQLYGRKPQYVDSNGVKHISDNGVCTNLGQIAVGDTLHMTTRIDSRLHPYEKAMKGSVFEPIMAINNVYIGLD